MRWAMTLAKTSLTLLLQQMTVVWILRRVNMMAIPLRVGDSEFNTYNSNSQSSRHRSVFVNCVLSDSARKLQFVIGPKGTVVGLSTLVKKAMGDELTYFRKILWSECDAMSPLRRIGYIDDNCRPVLLSNGCYNSPREVRE